MSTSCRGGNLIEAAKLFSCRLDVLAPSDVLESRSEEVAICGNVRRVGCPKRRKFGLRVPPNRTSRGLQLVERRVDRKGVCPNTFLRIALKLYSVDRQRMTQAVVGDVACTQCV